MMATPRAGGPLPCGLPAGERCLGISATLALRLHRTWPQSPFPDPDPDQALRSVIQAWVSFNERRWVNFDERRREYDVYARVYPFGGAFFLGTGIGYEAVQGTLATTVDLTPYQQGLPAGLLPNSVDYASQGSVKTLVLTPQIGLFHTFGSGFSLGFDVGLQVPIAPSQVTSRARSISWMTRRSQRPRVSS